MLEDFDDKKIVRDIYEYGKLQEIYISALKKRNKLLVSLDNRTAMASTLQKQINDFDSNNKISIRGTFGIGSRILSIFHRGTYYKAKVNKERAVKELEESKQQIEELKENARKANEDFNRIYERKNVLSDRMEVMQNEVAPDGRLIITDKESNFEEPNKVKTVEEAKDKVIVHCTSLFPSSGKIKSSYSAGRIETDTIEYCGVEKEVPTRMHRHEIHVTINSRVESTGDGKGNWDNPRYIIIDDYNEHENELENINAGDSWTKGEDIELSEKAVILVDIKQKDKLPKEAENFKIVYYRGDPTKCLNRFLQQNHYSVINKDKNTAPHANSLRKKQEDICNKRDLIINYYKDGNYDEIKDNTFSKEEIEQIINIAINLEQKNIVDPGYEFIDDVIAQSKIDIEGDKDKTRKFVEFIYLTGLKKDSDGLYRFASDEEVLNRFRRVSAHYDALEQKSDFSDIDKIDFELMREMAEHQQEIDERNAKMEPTQDINNMSMGDLYKFKNLAAASAASKLWKKLKNTSPNERYQNIMQAHKLVYTQDGALVSAFGIDKVFNVGKVIDVKIGDTTFYKDANNNNIISLEEKIPKEASVGSFKDIYGGLGAQMSVLANLMQLKEEKSREQEGR